MSKQALVGERVFSRRAVVLAMESEYGPRLVEIAQLYFDLFRLLIDRKLLNPTELESIKNQIEALRIERNSILEKFEEGI